MAKLVLGVGTSHGPSIQSPPERWAKLADGDTRDPRFDYQALLRAAPSGLDRQIHPDVQRRRHADAHAAIRVLRQIVEGAKLDALIVVSNPHRIRPADNHPVFGIFRAETFPTAPRSGQPFDPDERFMDEDRRPAAEGVAEKPGHAALADHLLEALIADGFDVACCDRLPDGATLDDAYVFPCDWLTPGIQLPMVPFLLSRDLPNQAHPRRCYDLGTALGRAIEEWPSDARVGLVASGGLSHQVLDEEFDRRVIAALMEGDAEILSSLPRDRLNRGPGTPEILNWVTVAAAMAPRKMTLVDYLPCYRSLAGTGHGLTFGYWL